MVARRFTLADQHAFATLSGDWNPVHVDPVAARRTNFGRAVVHGVHLVLWSLDLLAADQGGFRLAGLDAEFSQPVCVGDLAEVLLKRDGDRSCRVRIEVGGRRCASFRLAQLPPRADSVTASAIPPRQSPREWNLDEMAAAAGTLPLAADPHLSASLFPHLAATGFDRRQLAQLLASTRLVGMVCPGLHSVLGDVNLRFDAAEGAERLEWSVRDGDPRFSLLTLGVRGAGLVGTVNAYVRPRPSELPDPEQFRTAIPTGGFAGQRVLVIGGSRGLGAVAALAAAAGGASVRLTWREGGEDAERVVAMARALGAGAESCRCDVGEADAMTTLASALGPWRPSHLGLFATPRIERTAKSGFSAALFDQFSRFYVTVIADAVAAFQPSAERPLRLLYPSTAYLDAPAGEWLEYCAAKADGEALCHQLAATVPGLSVTVSRLARAATDQTLSLRPIATEPPLAVLATALKDWRAP